MTALAHAALALARRGLRIFPIVPYDKKPAIEDNLNLATSDDTIVRAWWSRRDYNIGIATGPGSGVWVLDLDSLDDEQWLRKLEAQHGALPPTVEAITARGRHLYFKWPAGAFDIRNVQGRDDFPDVRGEGGYVLAPPSIHPIGHYCGRNYCWSVDTANTFADAPQWLVSLVAKSRDDAGEPIGMAPEAWRSFLDGAFDGSHRGRAIAKLAGMLLRRYVDPFVALSLCRMFNAVRCAEPLADDEVFRIVDRIARREADRREHPGQGGDA
jgi:hypothetical protein